MIHFNNLFTILTFRAISKDFYCFNEDSNDIQDFHFNEWDHFGNQVDDNSSVVVGVSVEI